MKDTTEDFMEIAIAEARKGMNKGNRPFGSVIVKHGAVAARAHSTSLSDHDVTAHAELKAIRNFFKKTKTGNLKGCMIYATGEPCLMCSAAIALANISELTIAANSGDLPKGMASRPSAAVRSSIVAALGSGAAAIGMQHVVESTGAYTTWSVPFLAFCALAAAGVVALASAWRGAATATIGISEIGAAAAGGYAIATDPHAIGRVVVGFVASGLGVLAVGGVATIVVAWRSRSRSP